MKYNDMSTAPKDGTEILVWNEVRYAQWDDKGNLIEPNVEGRWMKVAWLEDGVNYPNSSTTLRWCEPDSWQDEQGGYNTANNPICWTNLPEAPQ